MKKFGQTADQLLSGLAQQFNEVSKLIRDLQGPITDLKKIEITRQELAKRLQPFGDIVHTVVTTFKPKVAELYENLIILADKMDKLGYYEIADKIDNIANVEDIVNLADNLDKNNLSIFADAVDNIIKYANYGFVPKVRENKCPEETEDPLIQSPRDGSLSTRYCPDHIGAQAIRIAEHIFQCPYDGKIYNYQEGYVNYKGQKVLGGSVSEQTPPTSNWGGIPMRIYDSRQNLINKSF